jgi:hypothetical protein
MRAYRLHDSSWTRIVTQRVRRPEAIAARLASRRGPDHLVPADGQLVLLACNHRIDPRTSEPIERRELLDRIVEALSIPEIDGVIATADLLEELTLLNVLEHRHAICSASGDCSPTNSRVVRAGVTPATIAACGFDGAHMSQMWLPDTAGSAIQSWCVAADMAELAGHGLPTVLDLVVSPDSPRSTFHTSWSEWIEPIQITASAMATGSGVWITVPAINGLSHIADATAFPILVRDTDVPVAPSAWSELFATDLPLTVRGLIPGVSALFPLSGSVAEAIVTLDVN